MIVLSRGPKTHLRARVPFADERAGHTVPEPDGLICRTASAGQYTPLVWVPCDRLDSRAVLCEAPRRALVHRVPHEQLVVVTATGELIRVCVPAKPAHFLLVKPLQSANVLIRHARVTVQDGAVA